MIDGFTSKNTVEISRWLKEEQSLIFSETANY